MPLATSEGTHPEAGEVVGDPAPPDLGTSPEEAPAPEAAAPERELDPAERANAALAEKNGATQVVVYRVGERELDIQVPARLPASFKFRLGALDDNDPVILRVIRKLIGSEQWEQIMDAMDEAGFFDDAGGDSSPEADESIGNFVSDVAATYGLTPGESQASPTS
jgi:hypothetical protein